MPPRAATRPEKVAISPLPISAPISRSSGPTSPVEDDQLAALAGVPVSAGAGPSMVRSDHVRPLAQHPPDEMKRQFIEVQQFVTPIPRARLTTSTGTARLSLGDRFMLEDPFEVARAGSVNSAIPIGHSHREARLIASAPRSPPSSSTGKPTLMWYSHHVRSRIPTNVLNLVVDCETGLADDRFDPSPQHQMLAEHGRLQHLALGIQNACISVPTVAISDQPGGCIRDSAVESKSFPVFRLIVVLIGSVLGEEERVIEPAGGDQTATHVRNQPRSLCPRTMAPCNRLRTASRAPDR